MGLFGKLFGPRRRSAKADPPAAALVEPSSVGTLPIELAPDPASPKEPGQPCPAPISGPSQPIELDEPTDDLDEELATDADDPTIGMYEALRIDTAEAGAVTAARAVAEALALAGPHRITPSDPVGPGSLAEVLRALESKGQVVSRVLEDPEFGFHLLYEPVSP